MLQAETKSLSKPQETQKTRNLESVAVDVYNVELNDETYATLIQFPKFTEWGPPNNSKTQSLQELRKIIVLDSDKSPEFRACIADQAKELLESPPNNGALGYQGGVGDDDPFSWDVERVAQHFDSIISSPMFEEALRSHQIAGWLLLWEVNSEALKEELLVEDVAQQDIIWNSILELRQKSKGYQEWTAEWGFDAGLAMHR